jgi:hypothetical protein
MIQVPADLEALQRESEEIRREIIENMNPEDVENKPQLFVRPFIDKKFDSQEIRQVNKIMLQVSTKQIQYHMMLSKEERLKGSKKEVHILDLKVDQRGKLYRVRAELRDLKKGQLRNKYSLKNFKRPELYRKIQVVLEILFLSELQKLIEKEERLQKAKDRGKKPKPFDSGLDAFRKRILEIKKKLQNKLSAFDKKRKKDKQQEEEDDKDKEDEEEEEEEEVAKAAKSKKKVKNLARKNKKKKRPVYEEFSYFSTGSRIQDSITGDQFDPNQEPFKVFTQVPHLSLAYIRGQYLDTASTYFWVVEAEMGRLVKEFTKTIDHYMRLQLGVGYDPKSNPLYAKLDFERENFNFFNLVTIGGELQPANNTITWANVSLGTKFKVMSTRTLRLIGSFGTLMALDSNYESFNNTTTVTGTKINVKILLENLWRRFGANFEYSLVTVEAVGPNEFVNIDGTQMLFSGIYTF